MKYLKIKKDAAGNLDDVNVKQADLAGRAAAADNAVNVSDTINGKTITSIFEADGITARKATSAGSAGNVASTINLKKITDIFESDGLKVKKASSATKLETARTVRTNLASTNAASFDGSANITPGVSGVLPLANGGTGATSLDGANIVTKNTQQAITGQKKFNDYALVLNDHADFISNDIDINSNPTSEKFAYFNGKDKNGNMLGAIGFYQDPAGNTGAYLQANRGAAWGGNLGIKTKAGTSDVFAYAPNPPDNSNTNQIATTYWVTKKIQNSNGAINPNLLINPDFVINQRRNASYTSAGYTLDRWQKTSNPLTSNLIGTVYSSSSTQTGYPGLSHGAYIQQMFEDDLQLGSDYTLTLCVQSNVDGDKPITKSFTYKLPETKPTGSVRFITERIYLDSAQTYFVTAMLGYKDNRFYVGISASLSTSYTNYSKVKLCYAKLEQGSTATPFMPPDMATELLKCQRYYVRYYNNGNTFGNGFSSKDTIGFILIVLPAVMRKTPTCKLSGVYSISANHLASSSKPVTFYGNLNFNMNSVKFEVQGSGFTVNEPIMLQIRTSDGYIEFDSEI